MNYLEFKVAMQDAEDKMVELGVEVDECDLKIFSADGEPIRIVLDHIQRTSTEINRKKPA